MTEPRVEYWAFRDSPGGAGYSDGMAANSRAEALAELEYSNERDAEHGFTPISSIAEYTGPICTGTATAENDFIGAEWQGAGNRASQI